MRHRTSPSRTAVFNASRRTRPWAWRETISLPAATPTCHHRSKGTACGHRPSRLAPTSARGEQAGSDRIGAHRAPKPLRERSAAPATNAMAITAPGREGRVKISAFQAVAGQPERRLRKADFAQPLGIRHVFAYGDEQRVRPTPVGTPADRSKSHPQFHSERLTPRPAGRSMIQPRNGSKIPSPTNPTHRCFPRLRQDTQVRRTLAQARTPRKRDKGPAPDKAHGRQELFSATNPISRPGRRQSADVWIGMCIGRADRAFLRCTIQSETVSDEYLRW